LEARSNILAGINPEKILKGGETMSSKKEIGKILLVMRNAIKRF